MSDNDRYIYVNHWDPHRNGLNNGAWFQRLESNPYWNGKDVGYSATRSAVHSFQSVPLNEDEDDEEDEADEENEQDEDDEGYDASEAIAQRNYESYAASYRSSDNCNCCIIL